MRLIVGMTEATGAVLGVRLLEQLKSMLDVETHLVISHWARSTIELETGLSVHEIGDLADAVYSPEDQGAAVSSGSFRADGMVIAPCSMKTLAGIRAGYANTLMGRAADVVLKKHRPLVLVPRESRLSEIHLENMLALARMEVHIVPPMLAFHQLLSTVDEIVDHIVARVLDQFGLPVQATRRRQGMHAAQTSNF